ncbi:MAG: hypothetical protein IT561_12960 [Alphaproteobacteria bacterium]|nr:hypothetical protein [Alphaproteobacteria bacterium]
MAAARTLLVSLLLAFLGMAWGADAHAHGGHGQQGPASVARADAGSAARADAPAAFVAPSFLQRHGDCGAPSGANGGMVHSSGCCASSCSCCVVPTAMADSGPTVFEASAAHPPPDDPRRGTSPGIDIRPPISRLR